MITQELNLSLSVPFALLLHNFNPDLMARLLMQMSLNHWEGHHIRFLHDVDAEANLRERLARCKDARLAEETFKLFCFDGHWEPLNLKPAGTTLTYVRSQLEETREYRVLLFRYIFVNR